LCSFVRVFICSCCVYSLSFAHYTAHTFAQHLAQHTPRRTLTAEAHRAMHTSAVGLDTHREQSACA